MKNYLAKELYKFYRSSFRKLRASGQTSIERTKNTDPQSLESVLSEVIAGRNWGKGLLKEIYLVIGRRLLELRLLNTQHQSQLQQSPPSY